MAVTSGSQIEQLLGDEAQALLEYEAQGISSEVLNLPGPDAIDRVMVKEQHPPIPQGGLRPLQLLEVAGDIGAAFIGERPGPRRKRKLEPPDA